MDTGASITEIQRVNLQDSPLLYKIPPELRNIVYWFVLTSDSGVEVTVQNIQARASLLKVSRQIRQEATQIFYAENRLEVLVINNGSNSGVAWLASIGQSSAVFVCRVTIKFQMSEKSETFMDCSNCLVGTNHLGTAHSIADWLGNMAFDTIVKLAGDLLSLGVRDECVTGAKQEQEIEAGLSESFYLSQMGVGLMEQLRLQAEDLVDRWESENVEKGKQLQRSAEYTTRLATEQAKGRTGGKDVMRGSDIL